ncbi:MAG: hypothetical protein Q9201_001796 [Fulgogasparrea decipioides]
MSDLGIDARIKFLDDSARLLQSVAPGTSAHLMHQRNIVAEDNEKALSKVQLKDICKTCGTILVSGVTSRVEAVDPNRVKKKKKRRTTLGPEAPEERFKTECRACRRVSKTPSQWSQKHNIRKLVGLAGSVESVKTPAPANNIPTKTSVAENEKPASTNISSKRRAKARKQGGLQALLNKSKETTMQSSSLELSLMDFMKET